MRNILSNIRTMAYRKIAPTEDQAPQERTRDGHG